MCLGILHELNLLIKILVDYLNRFGVKSLESFDDFYDRFELSLLAMIRFELIL